MSSVAIILSSSAAVIQTRSFLSPAVAAKESQRCNTVVDTIRQLGAISSLQAFRLQTLTTDGLARSNRSPTVANAGLGRFSGAIHGNSKKKSRSRRRPPVQQDDPQEGDEHQDGESGSGGLPKPQIQEEEGGEFTAGAEECEDFAAAEGVISTDGSSDQNAQRLSYTRYLQELGVSPRPSGEDTESERDSAESLRELDGVQDEISSDNASQLSDEGSLHKDETISQAGSEAGEEGDLGHEGTIKLDSKRENDAVRGPGKITEKSDIFTGNEVQSENKSDSVEDPSRVDPTVVPTLDPNSSSSNEGEEKVFGHDGQNTETMAELGTARDLHSVSDHGPVKKKGRQKSKFKDVGESSLKLEERGDTEHVRASFGGAERPAIHSDKDFSAMDGSATTSKRAGTVEPEVDSGTREAPQEAEKVKSISEPSLEAEAADSSGQISTAVASKVDSNSMMDTTNEDKSPHTPLPVIGKAGSEVVETVLERVVETASKVIPGEIVEQAAQVASKVVELPVVVVEHAAQVRIQVVEILPDVVTEQVEQVAESVSSTASQVAEQVTNGVEAVTSTASQVVDQVTEFFTSDEDDDSDSDDEFEAYITSDLPEFRGKAGLDNFIIRNEDQGVLSKIHDIYAYMLKQSFPRFAAAMFLTPILVSGIFTLLYLPQFDGLAFDETARDFFASPGGEISTFQMSWRAVFEVFMFSLSLSTGLQPEIAPVSPYTLIVANLNALVAQLIFVFLSGAVFARLSQPSHPLRCSAVALVSASSRRRQKENPIKIFMARFVLAGPQPCELVDVKVDLTYKYNTLTRTGSYFRATQSLKLVRPEIAFLTFGLLVRHVIDETSPLYQRTPEMLNKEDAIFCLSVVGLERASMQSVFHVEQYCVVDNDVIWNAEFEDMVLINKKNRRIVDHSRLSMWRPFAS